MHRAQEAGQAHGGNGSAVALNIGDAPVSHGEDVPRQLHHALPVFRLYAAVPVEDVVNGHHRQRAGNQLHHLGIIELGADDAHAVHIPVEAVLQIRHRAAAQMVRDEGDVIAAMLGLGFESLEHGREVIVRQSAVVGIKEDAQIEGAPTLQSSCQCAGAVAQLLGCGTHERARLLRDVGVIVERLAHSGNGQPAGRGQLLDGHGQ